jgi:abequosyltransferase
MSGRLSVAVPTYNRASILPAFFDALDEAVENSDISICICDNASDDSTKEIVERRARNDERVRYFRNETTIFADENFEQALKLSDTQYVWLLGDTYVIEKTAFQAVLNAIGEDDYDVIILNLVGRVTDIKDQVYTDRNRLLRDLGWHMTCMSTLVYNRRLLTEAKYKRYRDTNFLQTGIIFEYLSDKPFKVKWIASHSVRGLHVPGQRKKGWEDQTFEIWTKRWANFVFSLPASYGLDAKMKCIMDHGDKGGVFSLKAIMRYRKRKRLDSDIYRQYVSYFPLTIKHNRFLIKIIAWLPSWFFRVI